MLCVELVGRLKDAREGDDGQEDENGVWPKTLVFSWRDSASLLFTAADRDQEADTCRFSASSTAGAWSTKSKQVPFPFHRPVTADGPIFKLSSKLMAEVLAPNLRPGKAGLVKLNILALSFTSLARPEQGQRGIEGFLKPGVAPVHGQISSKGKGPAPPEPPRGIKKFFAPTSASTSASSSSSASTSASSSRPPTPKKPRRTALAPADSDPDEVQILDHNPFLAASTFLCSKCKKSIPVPGRGEHDDWHLARDLQADVPSRPVVSSSSSSAGGKKRKKGHGDGDGGGLAGWLVRKKS